MSSELALITCAGGVERATFARAETASLGAQSGDLPGLGDGGGQREAQLRLWRPGA